MRDLTYFTTNDALVHGARHYGTWQWVIPLLCGRNLYQTIQGYTPHPVPHGWEHKPVETGQIVRDPAPLTCLACLAVAS